MYWVLLSFTTLTQTIVFSLHADLMKLKHNKDPFSLCTMTRNFQTQPQRTPQNSHSTLPPDLPVTRTCWHWTLAGGTEYAHHFPVLDPLRPLGCGIHSEHAIGSSSIPGLSGVTSLHSRKTKTNKKINQKLHVTDQPLLQEVLM